MHKKLIHGLTHSELVKIALRWLLNTEKCSVAICEMRSQMEEPDAIGWKAAFSTLVECKATRGDFRSDLRKGARQHVMFGMGTHRYYMTPEGMVESDEVPKGWGLLEVTFTGRVKRTVESARWTLCPIALRNELGLVLSGLRRYQDEERMRCGA